VTIHDRGEDKVKALLRSHRRWFFLGSSIADTVEPDVAKLVTSEYQINIYRAPAILSSMGWANTQKVINTSTDSQITR